MSNGYKELAKTLISDYQYETQATAGSHDVKGDKTEEGHEIVPLLLERKAAGDFFVVEQINKKRRCYSLNL